MSGTQVSTPACGFSWLIAANHALHRLLTPRHPPCALSSLTTKPFGRFHDTTYRVEAKVRSTCTEPFATSHAWWGTRIFVSIAFARDISRRFAKIALYEMQLIRACQLFNFQRRPRKFAEGSAKTVTASARPADFLRGGYGNRTHDPRLAKPLLSQLS